MHWRLMIHNNSGSVVTKEFVRFVDVLEELDHIDEDELIKLTIEECHVR